MLFLTLLPVKRAVRWICNVPVVVIDYLVN